MTTENFLMVALYRDAIDIKDVKELNIEPTCKLTGECFKDCHTTLRSYISLMIVLHWYLVNISSDAIYL